MLRRVFISKENDFFLIKTNRSPLKSGPEITLEIKIYQAIPHMI